jgi:tetratricopeptide (TPR) repeat protein
MKKTKKSSFSFIPLSNQDKAIIIMALFFGIYFGRFYGIAYWENGTAGAILGCVISLTANLILLPIKNWIAGVASKIYGSRTALWSLREQLEGDLNEAKYFKRQKKHDKALSIINDVLKQDPEFPEALYIKATILWEGFNNAGAAKVNLKKAMDSTSNKSEPVFRWAFNLYNELTRIQKGQQDHPSIYEE